MIKTNYSKSYFLNLILNSLYLTKQLEKKDINYFRWCIMQENILSIRNLAKTYHDKNGETSALENITFK